MPEATEVRMLEAADLHKLNDLPHGSEVDLPGIGWVPLLSASAPVGQEGRVRVNVSKAADTIVSHWLNADVAVKVR